MAILCIINASNFSFRKSFPKSTNKSLVVNLSPKLPRTYCICWYIWCKMWSSFVLHLSVPCFEKKTTRSMCTVHLLVVGFWEFGSWPASISCGGACRLAARKAMDDMKLILDSQKCITLPQDKHHVYLGSSEMFDRCWLEVSIQLSCWKGIFSVDDVGSWWCISMWMICLFTRAE